MTKVIVPGEGEELQVYVSSSRSDLFLVVGTVLDSIIEWLPGTNNAALLGSSSRLLFEVIGSMMAVVSVGRKKNACHFGQRQDQS